MPDVRNGPLEGEQYLEVLQVPPSSCPSLKNSSLLCPLCSCSQGAYCAGERWGGFVDMRSAGHIGKKCSLLHFLVSFAASRYFFSTLGDGNRVLFSCRQLLAISNWIHSVLRTAFNAFLPR